MHTSLIFARNEVKLWSSRFHNHRLIFYIILTGVMGLYSFLLVPLILSTFYVQISSFFNSLGLGLPIFIYYAFSLAVLYIFVFCLTVPISSMFKYSENHSGRLEILLGTPIKNKDIFLGKFIGSLPINLIILFIIAPWFVNIFLIANPIPILGILGIYAVLIFVMILGLWFGNLLSAYFETKIRKSKKSEEFGKVAVLFIGIFTAIIMYLMIWVMMTGFSNPNSTLNYILQGFPSTWGTIIIMNILGYTGVSSINVGFFIFLLVGLTAAVLYIGYKGAGRFYSLEPIKMKIGSIIKENLYYRFFRKIIPGNFKITFLTELKGFSRKLSNFARLGYGAGFAVIMSVFNMIMDPGPGGASMFIVLLLMFVYALITSLMLGGYSVVGSIDHFCVYKKVPNGVNNFVKSVFSVRVFYALLIGSIFPILFTIIRGFSIFEGFMIFLFMIGHVLSLMACAIGIAFMFPAFEEKSPKIAITLGIFMVIPMVSVIGGIMIGSIFLKFLDPYYEAAGTLLINSILGFIVLNLGIRKIKSLE